MLTLNDLKRWVDRKKQVKVCAEFEEKEDECLFIVTIHIYKEIQSISYSVQAFYFNLVKAFKVKPGVYGITLSTLEVQSKATFGVYDHLKSCYLTSSKLSI